MAVLCVNAGPLNSTADFEVSMAQLGFSSDTSEVNVRDIWRMSDAPAISAGGTLRVSGVAGHSSRFFRLAPRQVASAL
eukprot:COSAG05_NODE_377_length_10608_cov_17.523361_10_plen_78_part_00